MTSRYMLFILFSKDEQLVDKSLQSRKITGIYCNENEILEFKNKHNNNNM